MKTKILLTLAMALGLTLGMAGMAFAAKASCGACHGTLAVTASEVAAGHRAGFESTPSTEDTKTPVDPDLCNSKGRGLHGIHMNYSSVTYGKTGGTRGNCNYCHASHIHENGYVEMEGYDPAHAVGTITSSGVTLNAGGTGYAAGDIASINGGTGGAVTVSTVNGSGTVLTFSISSYRESYGYSVTTGIATTNVTGTGTGLKVNVTAITNNGLRQTVNSVGLTAAGTGSGVNGFDISQIDGSASCTVACHKGTSSSNAAPWGNYTSSSVRLSCNACHDDVSNVASSGSLSGAHYAHLTNGAAISGGSAMNSAANAGCVDCHTANTGDGRAANDFGARAYPHASDGTNVLADNATLTGQITAATKSGLTTTCTAACHPRSNLITPAVTWGGTMDCNMCHYNDSTPTAAENNAISTGSLPGAHNLHFTGGLTCDKCHPVPTDTAHVTAMPVSSTGVTFVAGLGNTGSGLSITCQNSCHKVMSPAFSTTVSVTGCATCHNYPNSAGIGQGTWALSTNGHTVKASTFQDVTTPAARKSLKHLNADAAYHPLSDSYGTVTGNANLCGKCHSGASHMNGTKDVSATNGLGTSCSTNFTFNAATTISTPSATHSNATCSNAKCHFGRTTPNWN